MKTIIAQIAWTSNEYMENPSFVEISLSDSDIVKINMCKQLCTDHNLHSIKIAVEGKLLDIDKQEMEKDFICDVENLIIYADSVIYYGQHKYDSASQIESETIHLD